MISYAWISYVEISYDRISYARIIAYWMFDLSYLPLVTKLCLLNLPHHHEQNTLFYFHINWSLKLTRRVGVAAVSSSKRPKCKIFVIRTKLLHVYPCVNDPWTANWLLPPLNKCTTTFTLQQYTRFSLFPIFNYLAMSLLILNH